MKILVVDDNTTMRRIIRNQLNQIGYLDVTESDNGVTALQKLQDDSFGLVISDWSMAPMSGLQLLKEIRVDTKLKTTPFIMVIEQSKTESVMEARQAGVDQWIVKPFNADTLKQKIQSVLGTP